MNEIIEKLRELLSLKIEEAPPAGRKPFISDNLFEVIDQKILDSSLKDRSSPSIKILNLIIDTEDDIEIEVFSLGGSINSHEIIKIEPDGDQFLLKHGQGSFFIPSKQKLEFGTVEGSVASAKPIPSNYSIQELSGILFETGKQRFDFTKTVDRWGVKNQGEFASLIQKEIDKGTITRRIFLETTSNPGLLKELFVANVLGFYRPLVYHEFQRRDIEAAFKKHGLQSKLSPQFKGLLESKYYTLKQFQKEINDLNEQAELGVSKKDLSNFFAMIRRSAMGGDLQDKNYRPSWFDDAFIEKWHARYKIFDKMIIKEHFPAIETMNGKTINYFDKDKNKLVEVDLVDFLGPHYKTLSYLFSKPSYYYKVETEKMPWYLFTANPFYDGITVTRTSGGRNYDFNQPAIEFQPASVNRFISIHPVELLCCDVFGWEQLVRQTMHHEIIHVLQEAQVNCFMYYAIINGRYIKNNSSKAYNHILKIVEDVDKDILSKILVANMDKLYIKENVSDMPAVEARNYNLVEYVGRAGGHTKAFIDVVNQFSECKAAWAQRKQFLEKITATMFRIYGESIGSGQTYLCDEARTDE